MKSALTIKVQRLKILEQNGKKWVTEVQFCILVYWPKVRQYGGLRFLTLRAWHMSRVRTKCKQKTRAGVENAVARDTDTGMTRPGPGAAFVPGGPYEAGRARWLQSKHGKTDLCILRVVPHRAMHLNWLRQYHHESAGTKHPDISKRREIPFAKIFAKKKKVKQN